MLSLSVFEFVRACVYEREYVAVCCIYIYTLRGNNNKKNRCVTPRVKRYTHVKRYKHHTHTNTHTYTIIIEITLSLYDYNIEFSGVNKAHGCVLIWTACIFDVYICIF